MKTTINKGKHTIIFPYFVVSKIITRIQVAEDNIYVNVPNDKLKGNDIITKPQFSTPMSEGIETLSSNEYQNNEQDN